MRCLLVSALFLFFSTSVWSVQNVPQPLKGESDPASYRQIILANGLKVLLVSDKRAVQSIAALSVGTGYFDDPESVAGAAHLLEHVVSKGSARFPDAAEYKQYLADNGGASNASTSALTTTYHFYVNAKDFDGALDRFAGQFDSPLLKPETILHEANAVESEFRMKFTDNYRKYREVLRRVFNTKHPYRKFSTGNRKTLLENNPKKTIDAVIEVFDQYYFSQNMGLVLFGPQSLEQLEYMAKVHFARIRSGKKESIARNFVEPIEKIGLNKLIKIKPLTSKRRLSMNYLVPGRFIKGNEGIGNFLSWVIDGKHEGGLENYLQKQELIYDLKASLNVIDHKHDLLTIEFRMTPNGLKSADAVLSATYDFLTLVSNHKNFKKTYQIYRDIQLEKFSRKEKSWTRNGIRNLSKNLLRSKNNLATKLVDLPSEFDFDSVKMFLRKLNSDQLIMVTQNNLYQIGGKYKNRGRFKKIRQKGLIEPIYQTPYHVVDLNWKYVPIKDIEFQLPSYPKYLTKIAEIKKKTKPRILRSGGEKEKAQKALNQIKYVISPQALHNDQPVIASGYKAISLFWDDSTFFKSSNPESRMFNKLLHKRISYSLAGIKDEARDSLIALSTQKTDTGFAINLSGYQVSFDQVLKDIVSHLETYKLSDKELKATYRSLLIELKPRPTERLKKKISDRIKTHFKKISASRQSYLTLKEISEVDYRKYKDRFFDSAKLTVYATENVNKQLVLNAFINSAQGDKEHSGFIIKQTELVGLFEEKIKDKGNGVFKASFSDLKPIEAEIFTQLLARRIKAPMFHELRTVQQLGYRVSATTRRVNKKSLLELYIQSPTTNSKELLKALSLFIESFLHDLKNESDEEFLRQKNAFFNYWLASNSSIEESYRKSIWADRYGLSKNWRTKAESFIEALDRKKFLSLAKKYLEPKTENEIVLLTVSQ